MHRFSKLLLGSAAALLSACVFMAMAEEPMALPPPPSLWTLTEPFQTSKAENTTPPMGAVGEIFSIENRGYVSSGLPIGSFQADFHWTNVTYLGINGANYFDNLAVFFSGHDGGGVPRAGGSREVDGPCYVVRLVGDKVYLQEVKETGDVLLVEKTLPQNWNWDFYPAGTFQIRIVVDIEAQTVKAQAKKVGLTPDPGLQTLIDYQIPDDGTHDPIQFGTMGFYNRERIAGLNFPAQITGLTVSDVVGIPIAPPAPPGGGGDPMMPPGGNDPMMPPGGF